ncbi:myosin heavy chain, fast skeletal muscle-like [Anneissia japonica]|uniref:myosin heavy chain, fast skeletal muscle-like n=1 Tax=Anneissia japonica TaxID=1529436 RepID=UPI00142593C7|nr:myosin heavy chain, fast skeletal muscle-like [Anneissia japonica]
MEVESLKEWLDVTEKNHDANLREFRSSADSDKAKAISDLETAKADHFDRTDILRTEIADLKEKLAEATRKESSLIKDVENLTALKDDNEKESRKMEKLLSDKDRTAIDLRNEIDTMEEKIKRNGSEIDDKMTAYKEEIERNVKRMKELDATIAKKIREAAGLEDEIAVLKEGKERDGRKIKGLGVQLANKGREATALKDEIVALQTDLSRVREECADDRSAELSVILEKTKDELRRTSRDLAAAKEAEIRWKQWVEELKKARDETHESHAKELGSLRDDLEREKSDSETKLSSAKASHSDEIENLRTQISFLTEKESKLRRDAGKFHASLKEQEEKHLDRIAKLESDKISRSAEAEEALDECASLSEKLKHATDSESRSKEDLERWQAEKRSWQATAERRSADLDKLRDLLKTSEAERANLESHLSNVDKNVTDSKETDSLKRELERHRQEIRQLERLLSDEKRDKSELVFSKNKEEDELRSDLTKTKMEMDEIKRQLNFANNKVAEAYSEVTRIVENSEDGRSHEECRELLTRRLDEVERSLEKEKMKAADCTQMNKELMRQISYLTNEIETVNYGRSVEVSKLRRLLNDCRREGSQRQRREPPGRRSVGPSYNVVEDACSGSSACESEEEVDDDVSEDVLVGNSEENENPRPIPFVVDYRPSSTAYGGLIREDECSFHQLLNQARWFVVSEDEVPEAAKRLSDRYGSTAFAPTVVYADPPTPATRSLARLIAFMGKIPGVTLLKPSECTVPICFLSSNDHAGFAGRGDACYVLFDDDAESIKWTDTDTLVQLAERILDRNLGHDPGA